MVVAIKMTHQDRERVQIKASDEWFKIMQVGHAMTDSPGKVHTFFKVDLHL